MSDYFRPDVLVSTQWVADHSSDPHVRVLESNEDVLLYDMGHVPNAVKIDWMSELNDRMMRDYINQDAFARLMTRKAIGNDTTVVFYGDKNNWWATYSFWVFQLFGHTNAKIMDGGRNKWVSEGRPLTKDIPMVNPPAPYIAPPRNDNDIRVFQRGVLSHLESHGALVDVRSPGEFSGDLLHMPDYPQEGAVRGGHIPGAQNVPWAKAVNPDGTFKSADDLRSLYESVGITSDKDIVTYCRIGERSSHTWFVLQYLLGYPKVRNYDGSWTEWGNTVGVPIER